MRSSPRIAPHPPRHQPSMNMTTHWSIMMPPHHPKTQPAMTFDDLRKLGYNQLPDGSYSRQTTPALPHNSPPLPNSIAEPTPRQTLEPPPQRKEKGRSRTIVCITRRSCHVLDLDNFAGGCKPLIDQLRYAQLIPNDDPQSIELQFVQEKVETRLEEETIIDIRS